MAWLFGRRAQPQSNELTAASNRFQVALKNLMGGPTPVNKTGVAGIFRQNLGNGKGSIGNQMMRGIVNRVFPLVNKVQKLKMQAQMGQKTQGQAAAGINTAAKQLTQIANTNYYRYASNNNNKVYNKNGKLRNNVHFNGTAVRMGGPKPNQGPLLGPVSGAAAAAALPPSGVTLPNNVKKASNANAYFKKSNNGSNTWFPAIRNRNTGNWIISNMSAPHKKLNNNRFEPIGNIAV